MDEPARYPWNDFPDVLIPASESFVKQHHAYVAAKSGDTAAATELVFDGLSALQPRLVSAHAEEAAGVNAIPETMASAISDGLKWRHEQAVIQANTVSHTGASGYVRLQRQAIFSGTIGLGLNYVLVDDFIGQGGTLANLRGYVISQGGHVLGATVLSGKNYSAKLASTDFQIAALRRQHGHIEDWWRQRFGFGFECLTASEARYLGRTPTSERIIEGLEAVVR